MWNQTHGHHLPSLAPMTTLSLSLSFGSAGSTLFGFGSSSLFVSLAGTVAGGAETGAGEKYDWMGLD